MRGGPSGPSRCTSRPASLSEHQRQWAAQRGGRKGAREVRARASRGSSSRPRFSTSGSASGPRRCSTGDGPRRRGRSSKPARWVPPPCRPSATRPRRRWGEARSTAMRSRRDRAPDAPVRPAPAHLVPQVRRRAGRSTRTPASKSSRSRSISVNERGARPQCGRAPRAARRGAGDVQERRISGRSRSSRRSAARRPRRRATREGRSTCRPSSRRRARSLR